MNTFHLPDEIRSLVEARNRLRSRYKKLGLKFTLDGRLVGDIGEAIAAERFGVMLCDRSQNGVDGHVKWGEEKRTVQVKATGSNLGPQFRSGAEGADHLLFFKLDFENSKWSVVFNGPERMALKYRPKDAAPGRQYTLPLKKLAKENCLVPAGERLPIGHNCKDLAE